jgi:DNA-binding NarL/FixJ family response regulator
LTDRQREVMQQLLRGRTIGQIARELGIAEATAKHHAHAVYAAFGVSSRADLILTANRRGVASG